MNTSTYHYVQTLAETGNFTKAAERLYISQPALTKSINKLEETLGVKLFDRSTKPIRLTYAGERYLAGMQSLTAMQSQLMSEMQEIANMKKGKLRVGVPSTRSARWMPRILPEFLKEFPGFEVEVEEGTSAPLEAKLAREEIDLLIASALPLEQAGLDYQVLCSEQMMILTGQEFPLFKGMDLSGPTSKKGVLHYISPMWLHNQPYIAADKTQGLYRFATQMFSRFNIRPRQVLSMINTVTARDIAAQGVGFLLVPASSAWIYRLQEKDLLLCTITDPPLRRNLIISYKRGKELSVVAKRFIEITMEAAKAEQGRLINLPVVHDMGVLDDPPEALPY